MKKLICSLVVLFGLVSFSFGQEVENLIVSNGANELMESKVSGHYEFKFVTNLTNKEVEKAASFYIQNFIVDFNEETQVIKINMVENTASSRIVISRFLTYLHVSFVEVENDDVSISDFISKYLK